MDAAQKATLTARRTSLLAALGRAEAFQAAYDHERDQTQVELRLKAVERTGDKLEDVQEQLEDGETEEAGKEAHEAARADFETRLFAIKAFLLSKNRLIPQPRNPSTPNATSTLSGIKLPTISLPEFDGDYQQWLAFHDLFVALIHNNPDLPEIQKFHYLRAAVTGKAAGYIDTLDINAANYQIAWDILVEHFSNEYLLKKRHLQALFDLPAMERESASSLHSLVDGFQRHVRILEQLKEPTASWSTILEHLLCTRLHEDTIKLWEDHASTLAKPDFNSLIEFLQRRMRVLESISVNNNHSLSSAAATSHQTFHPQRQNWSNLSSLSSTTSSGFISGCAACGQDHHLYMCQKFGQLSVADRQQFVTDKFLCYNCLGGHSVRNCYSNRNCRHCQQRHHSLLHTNQVENSWRSSDNNQPAAPNQENEHLEVSASVVATKVNTNAKVSTSLQQPKDNVFLPTVLIKVVDSLGTEHVVRALLDSASQPNLISDRMAKILRLKRSSTSVVIQGAGQMSIPVRHSVSTEVRSRKGDFSCGINFLVMDKLTVELPGKSISTSDWHIPTELFLADPTFNECQPIDLILGAKHFYTFFPTAARLHLQNSLPMLVDSVFGWIVTGSANEAPSTPPDTTHSYSVFAITSPEENMKRTWRGRAEQATQNPFNRSERVSRVGGLPKLSQIPSLRTHPHETPPPKTFPPRRRAPSTNRQEQGVQRALPDPDLRHTKTTQPPVSRFTISKYSRCQPRTSPTTTRCCYS